MHPEVRAKWHAFSTPLEGRVMSMYVDVKGLVTTGVGNLIDSVAAASALPWKHEATGELATPAEVAAAWNALKAQRDTYAKLHWKYAAKLNDLRLSDRDVDDLVERVLDTNVAYLRRTFTKWDQLPADAQLGILSMAWAVGPGFTKTFANFTRAALAGQWLAVTHPDDKGDYACKIREKGNPGVVPRNANNRLCFANAQAVLNAGDDVTRLHWPDSYKGKAPAPSVGASEVFARARAAELQREAQAAMDRWTNSEYERLQRERHGEEDPDNV